MRSVLCCLVYLLLAPLTGTTFAAAHLAGNVVSVDKDKHELTITDAGRRRAIPLKADTLVRQGAEAKSISDLHHGDRIVVTLDDEGSARIVSIAGASAPPAAAAAGAHSHGGKGLGFIGGVPRPNPTSTGVSVPGFPGGLPAPSPAP